VARLPKSLAKAPVDDVRLSREEMSERQHRRILLAVTEVFAKRGYQAATVEHLITAAKISMGSFYDHFGTKEDCLAEVYDLIATEAKERIAAAMPSGGDWVERAYAGIHAALAFVAEQPLAARVVVLEAQTAGPELVRRYHEDLGQVADFLRRGRKVSALQAELPDSFEDATASGLAWMLQARLVRGEVEDVDGLFREMVEVALEPYLGTQRTQRGLAAFATAAG
jgi:AcrR family transcriptional regulator